MANDVATMLLQDPDPGVRRTAIEALKQEAQLVGAGEVTIEMLASALSDPHVAVQDAAAQSLMDCDPKLVAVHVLPLLHAAVQPRSMALEVLQQLGPQAVGPILQAAVHSDSHIRKFIADIVGHIGGTQALNGLLFFLNDHCPNVRASAAEALGNLGDTRAVEPLMALLHDQEEWVVFSAINALGNLKDIRATASLHELLASEDAILQGMVVEALGKIGARDVLPDLLDMLPTANRPLRHLLFVTILELVGDDCEVFHREEMQAFLFAELVAALKTREPEVQGAALRGLRLLGNAQATGALLQFLSFHENSEDAIHVAALDALTKIGDESQLLQMASSADESMAVLCIHTLEARNAVKAIPVLGELVSQSENREIRRAALMALGRMGVDGVEASVLTALQDLSGYVRGEAARIVAERGLQEGEPILWEQINHEPYPDAINEQVRAIVTLTETSTIKMLEQLLHHHRPEIREAVVAHWPMPLDPSVIGCLGQHLCDPDWRVRLKIVERLSAVHSEPVLEILISASTDLHSHIRQAVLQTLGNFPGRVSASLLRKAVLEDPDVWVRSRAVEQLAAVHDTAVVPFFLRILDGVPPLLQLAVVRALGTLGDPQAIEPLKRLQADAEPEVQQEVMQALAQLHVSPLNEGVAG